MAVALALVALAACGTTSHAISGRRFDDARACLERETSIDVLEGEPDDQRCAPACLVEPRSRDGGATIYVTEECPPYPPLFDATGSDPRCVAALLAASRRDYCLRDGGSTAPADPTSPGGAADGGDGGDGSAP